MKRVFRYTLVFFATAVVIAAGLFFGQSLFDSGTVWQDEGYAVEWIDSRGRMMVYRKLPDGAAIGRIGPPVTAVASDSRYLSARVTSAGPGGDAYYYLDKSMDSDLKNGSEIAVGPLTKAAFDAVRATLNIPEPVPF